MTTFQLKSTIRVSDCASAVSPLDGYVAARLFSIFDPGLTRTFEKTVKEISDIVGFVQNSTYTDFIDVVDDKFCDKEIFSASIFYNMVRAFTKISTNTDDDQLSYSFTSYDDFHVTVTAEDDFLYFNVSMNRTRRVEPILKDVIIAIHTILWMAQHCLVTGVPILPKVDSNGLAEVVFVVNKAVARTQISKLPNDRFYSSKESAINAVDHLIRNAIKSGCSPAEALITHNLLRVRDGVGYITVKDTIHDSIESAAEYVLEQIIAESQDKPKDMSLRCAINWTGVPVNSDVYEEWMMTK